MSHETETSLNDYEPILVIEPEPEIETISWIEVGQDYEWYWFVPLLDRDEWAGIEYDSVQYDWDELDYRFSVEYGNIPEPATSALLMGVFFACFLFKKFF